MANIPKTSLHILKPKQINKILTIIIIVKKCFFTKGFCLYPAKKDNTKKSDNKELEESQKQVQQLKEQLNKYKEKEIENYLKTNQGKK